MTESLTQKCLSELQITATKAIVVGLCGHGLAVVRDLHFNGVPVIALESNRNLPGALTCCAEIEFVPEVNGADLFDVLLGLAKRRNFSDRPVLFLTNDRMVETLGEHTKQLQEYYRLSMGPCLLLSCCRYSVNKILSFNAPRWA